MPEKEKEKKKKKEKVRTLGIFSSINFGNIKANIGLAIAMLSTIFQRIHSNLENVKPVLKIILTNVMQYSAVINSLLFLVDIYLMFTNVKLRIEYREMHLVTTGSNLPYTYNPVDFFIRMIQYIFGDETYVKDAIVSFWNKITTSKEVREMLEKQKQKEKQKKKQEEKQKKKEKEEEEFERFREEVEIINEMMKKALN